MAPPNSTNTKAPGQTNPPRAPAGRPSPSKTPSVNGVGRSPSLRGGLSRPARGGANRSSPQSTFLSTNATASDDTSEDDARAERASLMEDLRSRVQKAETASEEYQRQLNLLQARLDESQQGHGQLEDQLHEKNERVEELEIESVQAAHQKRDLEGIFESERAAMIKDRDEQKAKEGHMQTTIQRLKDSLAQRERSNIDEGKVLSRTCESQSYERLCRPHVDSPKPVFEIDRLRAPTTANSLLRHPSNAATRKIDPSWSCKKTAS